MKITEYEEVELRYLTSEVQRRVCVLKRKGWKHTTIAQHMGWGKGEAGRVRVSQELSKAMKNMEKNKANVIKPLPTE